MCQRVQCSQCGKPTFAGCGMHVELVLGDVPQAKRCKCAEEQPRARGGGLDWLFASKRPEDGDRSR